MGLGIEIRFSRILVVILEYCANEVPNFALVEHCPHEVAHDALALLAASGSGQAVPRQVFAVVGDRVVPTLADHRHASPAHRLRVVSLQPAVYLYGAPALFSGLLEVLERVKDNTRVCGVFVAIVPPAEVHDIAATYVDCMVVRRVLLEANEFGKAARDAKGSLVGEMTAHFQFGRLAIATCSLCDRRLASIEQMAFPRFAHRTFAGSCIVLKCTGSTLPS